MSRDRNGRHERDLILAPNEYAFILDETKGNIINYVGPHKTSLANTDQPVFFNLDTKRFETCSLDEAKRMFAIAPEGWYIVLKNPPKDGKYAREGTANTLLELDVGRKINIHGPISFAPWPGQMVRVIQGHNLRSNQYLTIRVYDDEGARTNWKKAVIKPQTGVSGEESKSDEEIPDFTMGKLLIIKGTDVSFYIPPTGIEVVPDENGQYVRNAVTLERLGYCILLDENGNKRYIKGPAVVFPKPTETFIEKDGSRRFKAIELNEISGLYIKVIAPYKEDDKSYKVGDELFITGKDQMIYFPRPEHAIIRYGDEEVYHAAAIPDGEGMYLLNRLTGVITLERGPKMLLPDPRHEVIVRRFIPSKKVKLWFPDNEDALAYNLSLMRMSQNNKDKNFVPASPLHLQKKIGKRRVKGKSEAAPATKEGFVGDEFTRDFSFPRTITLDTKYEGAVAIAVWTGYAILVTSKTDKREVIVGPKTYLLEYDETLGTTQFSTGTPKSDKNLFETVYLRVLYNKVSDAVEAVTKDLCPVTIHLSYRVNFEGDHNKWFDVENYVKFLTDHMRSILSHAIKQHGIEEFYADAIAIVRDTVLGKQDENDKRAGRLFTENGMRIYDVEVLGVEIGDEDIAYLLIDSQHTAVKQSLEVENEKRNQVVIEEKETIKQSIEKIQAVTKQIRLTLAKDTTGKELELALAKVESEVQTAQKKLDAKSAEQNTLDEISEAELARQKAESDHELAVMDKQIAQRIEYLKAEVEAVVSKADAVSPQLISALQGFSDKALAERMAESMAPLAILGGKSVADVLTQLLKGTALEHVLSYNFVDEDGDDNSF
ncbi:MAG: hypothetical protein B6242_00055 [Anaerolineaceae bacterium 4572_78]|nr:MAG: hypothetical protein B6242_00055 [Anaerolineaceae bacterium 4572_78]